MNKKIIPCRVREEYVEGAGVAAGAAGSGGDAVLQIEFGPMWEGLVKYVTFRDARKENPVTVLLTTDMIEVRRAGEQGCEGAWTGATSLPLATCRLGGRVQSWASAGPCPFGPETSPRRRESDRTPSPVRSLTAPGEGKGCEECPCREVLVYNVPIPAKAKAIAGQMGVVVQGYELTEDGQKVQSATMTANAYYKILPADYAPVEDGSVTATLSQQLQAQIEKIKGDIVGAAEAANAKEAAQKAAEEAQRAKTEAEAQATVAEKSAQVAAGSAGEAKTAAGDAQAAQRLAEAAAEQGEADRIKAEEAKTGAELAQEKSKAARDAAQLAQVGAEEAEDRAKGYWEEALAARDVARDARDKAEEARDTAQDAKEEAQECRTQAWMERVLAQDAKEGAEEARDQAGIYRDDSRTAQKESQAARDEAVLALQWIRMEQGDLREDQEELRALGQEVRELRESTKIDSEAAREAQEKAVKARQGAEAAADRAEEWAETARDLSGGDVATRREAKGYVKAHNADPLAHEGIFPRIGFVAGERLRDSWRPEYGLGGGGEEGGEISAVLEVEDHTGRAYLSAIVSGVEYDAVNMETDGDLSPNGTLIIKKLEEENYG